jgi:PAS domain S-box-containing protein
MKLKKESEEHVLKENIFKEGEQIVALKERIRQLEEQVWLHELLNDASIDRVMAFDPELNIIAWNKTSQILTGLRKENILGRNVLDIFPELKDCKASMDAIKSALKGYKVFVPGEKGPREGGYYENHYIPLKDAENRVSGVLNIKHDVAHRVKAENELKALNKSLARKNKELKQKNAEIISFSHITSHDLKEPLRKIYLFIEMLMSKEIENLTDDGKKYFRKIQASVQRMGLLTDDILAYSQVLTEEQNLSNVDLSNTLLFVKDVLNEYISSSGAIIESESLPVIQGYRNLLSQLFQNIIHNAIKFQKTGNKPVIRIGAENVPGSSIKHIDASPDAEYLKISFADNGIGFDERYSDKIFQMFQRLHTSDNFGGTGIGLAVCKKIAELHQGFMTAESTPGKGSHFHLFLPV